MAETVYGVLDRIERRQQEIEIGPNGLSIDLLRAVYRSSAQPLHIRMRAAMACLKHEVPALIATAIVNEGSFAELLDRRIEHLKRIEAKANGTKLINGQRLVDDTEPDPEPRPQAPTPSPLTRIYSPKFRRKF